MSEIPADTEYASILKTVPDELNPGNEVLRLTPQTNGKDVIATLRYITPDKATHAARLRTIIQLCIKKQLIAELDINLKDTPEASTDFRWDKATTEETLIDSLRTHYGFEEHALVPGFEMVVSQIIDHNILPGATISGINDNEMLAATDESIALEMRAMTEKFGRNI